MQLAVPATKEYLGLVAGRTLARVWTVATSGLLEDHLLSVSERRGAGGAAVGPPCACTH